MNSEILKTNSLPTFDMIWRKRYLTVRAKGSFRLQDFLKHFDERVATPKFDNLRFIVYDFREAESLDVSEEEMSKIYTYSQVSLKYVKHHKWAAALICNPSNSEKLTSFLHKVRTMNARFSIEVFRDEEEAVEWAKALTNF